jgi:sRNA-binding protein
MSGTSPYTGHYGYLLQLHTGAPRYDLHGKRCGTVTNDDAAAASQRIKEINQIKNQRREEESLYNGNGKLPAFIMRPLPTATIAKSEPAPAIAKPAPMPVIAVDDDRQKHLKLAVKRIELAASNLEDAEMAATILRNASDVIQQVIEKLTGQARGEQHERN